MSAQTDEDDDDRVDGRTARRDRNRVAVLDAVLELFAEGNLRPGVNEVAERSGVSLRSVYRYFADGTELIESAITRSVERAWPLYRLADVDEDASFEERLHALVRSRLELYQAVAPVARAANLLAPTQKQIRDAIDARRKRLLAQVERQFAPELTSLDERTRTHRVRVIDTLMQFEGAELLFSHHGMDVDEVGAFLTETVRTLLAP